MKRFIYCREEYNNINPINEGLLTGSFTNEKMSEKDSELNGYSLSKIKNFSKVKTIKKLLDDYIKSAEDAMIKEYDAMSDEEKKSYAGPLITMKKTETNDDESKDEGEAKDANKQESNDVNDDKKKEEVAKQEADESERAKKVEDERDNPRQSKSMTSSLRLNEPSQKLISSIIKNIEQVISSVKDDKIKEWARIMFTNAEIVISQEFIEHIEGDNKKDIEKQLNDIKTEQEKQDEKLSKDAKQEETKEKEEKIKSDTEEMKDTVISPDELDLSTELKNLGEENSDINGNKTISSIKEYIKNFNGEISDDTMRSICKTCSVALEKESDVLQNKEINDIYKSAFQCSLVLYQTICCCDENVIDSFIGDEVFNIFSKVALTDGGYNEEIAVSFQNTIKYISENPVYNGGTQEDIDEQSKVYKKNIQKVADAIKKKGEEIASQLEKENL